MEQFEKMGLEWTYIQSYRSLNSILSRKEWEEILGTRPITDKKVKKMITTNIITYHLQNRFQINDLKKFLDYWKIEESAGFPISSNVKLVGKCLPYISKIHFYFVPGEQDNRTEKEKKQEEKQIERWIPGFQLKKTFQPERTQHQLNQFFQEKMDNLAEEIMERYQQFVDLVFDETQKKILAEIESEETDENYTEDIERLRAGLV